MKTIKRYKNRKLYDSMSHKYINLIDLAALAKDKIQFRVKDFDGADITINMMGLALGIMNCTENENMIEQLYDIFNELNLKEA